MTQDLARQRLKDAGFQVADQANAGQQQLRRPVRSSALRPSGQTVPGSIITIQVSNGIPPPPPPPPAGVPADPGAAAGSGLDGDRDPRPAADHGAGAGRRHRHRHLRDRCGLG